jgi:tetratricopeptide (TPR) repeat protein
MAGITSLLGEIHRRSVWQILGSYAVGAWLVLQLADTVSSLIGLPLWFGPAIVALLMSGAPLLLLTAVVQGGRLSKEGDGVEASFLGLRRMLTWSNVGVGAAAVVVLFGFTTGGYLGMRRMGVGPIATLQAKGVIDHQERLILSDFDNRTDAATLGETVTQLFRIDLAQSSAITVLQPMQIVPVLARMERDATTRLTFEVALEVARREGLKAVIAGDVLPLGDGVVISARLVAAASGDVLTAERQTARNVLDVPNAVDRLSAKLRERIGESLRTIQGDPPLQQVTTRSLQALERYAQAESANDRGDTERAVALLEEALEEDSTFAMAHRKLAVCLGNLGRDPERVRREAAAAFEGRERLTDRERYLTEAAYFSYVEPDVQATIRAYETLLERYPTDPVALNNLALAFGDLGRLDEAERLYRRSVDAGGAPAVTYSNAIEVQVRLGMSDSAEVTWRRFVEAYPENPRVMSVRSALESARFRFDAAEEWGQRLLEATRGNPAWELQAELGLGHLALSRGRLEEALSRMRRVIELEERTPYGSVPAPSRHAEALFEAGVLAVLLEDTLGAVASLDRAIAEVPVESLSPGTPYAADLAVIYAVVGRPDAARAVLDGSVALRGTSSDPSAGTRDWPEALGWIAFAEGRYDDAAEQFLAWRDSVPECAVCGWFERAQVFRATEEPDSAIANLHRYLDADFLYRSESDAYKLWLAYRGLAELYQDQGEAARAVEYYGRFADLWKDADPPLQPRVRGAREAAQRLRGGP